MNKFFYFLSSLLIGFLFFTSSVLAQDSVEGRVDQIRGSRQIVFPSGIPSSLSVGVPYIGDLYFKADGEVVIDEEVDGDAYLAGGQIQVDERVRGDLLAAGGEVRIDGRVDQDVRVVGGSVNLSGQVGRNVTVVGGTVSITKDAQITGNLVVVGGNVSVNERARIVGKTLIKTPPQEKVQKPRVKSLAAFEKAFGVVVSVLSAVKWLQFLVMGLLLIVLLPKTLTKLIKVSQKQAGRHLLWGIVGSIVLPVLAILSFLTIVGIPLGMIILALMIVAWYLAKLIVMIFIGYYILEKMNTQKIKIFKKDPGLYASFLLGLLVFLGLGFIPLLGWLAKLLLIWIGFGVLLQEKWVYYRQIEK